MIHQILTSTELTAEIVIFVVFAIGSYYDSLPGDRIFMILEEWLVLVVIEHN